MKKKKNNIVIYCIIIWIILIIWVICWGWYIYGIGWTIDSYWKVDSARIEECKKALERCLEMNRHGSNQICPKMLSNGDCNIRH
jgi:hypothetical protein